MPQVIAIVLAGAGLYAGYRWLARQSARLADDLRRAEEALRKTEAEAAGIAPEPRDLGRLEWDEQAGVYRPTAETRH